MKTMIMGAGSLGTIAGAIMTRKGFDVLLVDANEEHVDALNRDGASVVGEMNFNVPVKAVTPDALQGQFDLVLYFVKQTANKPALTALLPHLHQRSIVVTMQNGVPEEEVMSYVGREKVLGCAVGWGATWIKPGVSELTSEEQKMTLDLGEPDGTMSERVTEVADVLNLICPTEVTTNLAGIRWAKLLINSTMSGMSAALGCTYGDLLDNVKALACVSHLSLELLKVAEALGVTLEPMQGQDLRMFSFKSEDEMIQKFAIYKALYGPHRLLKASMLQDLEKGFKTEIDAINGVVCVNGRKTGIATPVNETVFHVVKSIESGKLKPVFENLDFFKLPAMP
ncbi:MAG TPA: 2-dehydropantoate 2-reductase [Desulfomonilaceae bacterium]|nr:2-dehydropantoate 2-reductase [Desulfomonilaceae bacterium]